MNRLLAPLLAIAIALAMGGPAFAQAAVRQWAHETSDIAPDPAVRFGTLPNGMRYALRHNSLPASAVSIRFTFAFGSLYETASEQGLAHFIEHMAFNGSRNVPEGEMVRILERLGLAFGADTNASTGQDFTTYSLELPNAADELVDEGLFLLRETASELVFNTTTIDRERGVVLAEWRRGDNFQRRRSQQQLDFLLPGALAASRMPIGKPEVLEAATREQMVSLYQRYYRPERATLLIVGDFDVDAMERRIIARFSDWTGQGEPGAEPDRSFVPAAREPAASVFVHRDGGDSVAVYSLSPFTRDVDTGAQRRADNLLMFGIGALQRRLGPLANTEAPPFRSAGVSSGDVLQAAYIASGSVTIIPGEWARAVAALEQEWRRALLYGFTAPEIAAQVEALRASQKNQAEREDTRTTGALMNQLLSSVQNDTVFGTPSSGLARFETWAGDVTPEDVHEAFVRHMSIGTPLFFVASSIDEPGIGDAVIAAWNESAATDVTPPEARKRMPFAYTDFGRPGRVVSDTRIADIETRLVMFANNVHLNIRKTDFTRNSVRISLRLGQGQLDFPDEPFGLGSLMSAFATGGLEKHSSDDLRAILQGRVVSAQFGASGNSFGGTYATTPADLELQLQLLAAYVTHPGYRPEAERRWRQALVLSWPRADATAQAVWAARGLRTLVGGDRRMGNDPDDGAAFRSFVELRHYLTPILKTGAIEIAVVGDIDEDEVIRLVARTFGALPKRDAMPARWRSDRPVVFREDRSPLVLSHAGEGNQALVNVLWPVTGIDPDKDPQAVRVLAVLAAVMRLKVTESLREELGAAYSPSAGATISSIYPGLGYVSAGADVKPEDVDRAIAALLEIAQALRAGEISDDEFTRAITPPLETLPQNATSNSYWLNLISQAQTRPDIMARNRLEAVEASVRAVTTADVIAAAQAWLGPDNARVARVVPAPD
jgi:zinc protease